MIYILYEDINGWKVARSDGRLDKFTRYYAGPGEAREVLDNAGIHAWLSEMAKQRPMKVTVK